MKRLTWEMLLPILVLSTNSYTFQDTRQQQQHPRSPDERSTKNERVHEVGRWRKNRIDSRVDCRTARSVITFELSNKKELCFRPCPEPEEDWLQDRREAIFAGMGTLWATFTGHSTLIATISGVIGLFPETSVAEYGADAKIEMPNPVQQAVDRANKQCLVESLGSRECLVYEADAVDKLYQGVDNKLLLERLESATEALARIPAFVELRQWSKVTSVLTGQMGELVRTMGQLSSSATSDANVTRSAVFIKRVKNDLYSIADAVSRKDGPQVLKFHEEATNDLVAFIKAL
jgi:hypothetical protein